MSPPPLALPPDIVARGTTSISTVPTCSFHEQASCFTLGLSNTSNSNHGCVGSAAEVAVSLRPIFDIKASCDETAQPSRCDAD